MSRLDRICSGVELGTKIRRRRRELGMTQAQLGGESYSKSYVSQIESGRMIASPRALAYFARRLGKSVSYFAAPEKNLRAELVALLAASQTHIQRGQRDEAGEILGRAARLAMELQEEKELAKVHVHVGHIYTVAGRISQARLAYDEALHLYRQAGADDAIFAGHCSLANAVLASGTPEGIAEAITLVEDGLSTARNQDSPDMLVVGRAHLIGGQAALARNHLDTALIRFNQAREALDGRDVAGSGEVCLGMGMVAGRRGEWSRAQAHFRRALGLLSGIAAPEFIVVGTRQLAEAHAGLGQQDQAMALVRRAGALSAGIEDELGVVWATVRLAEVAAESGDLDTAHDAVGQAAASLAAAAAECGDVAGAADGVDPMEAAVVANTASGADAADGTGEAAETADGAETGVEAETTRSTDGPGGAGYAAEGPPREGLTPWNQTHLARLCRVKGLLAGRTAGAAAALPHLREAATRLRGVPGGLSHRVRVLRELGLLLHSLNRGDEAVECLAEALHDIEGGLDNYLYTAGESAALDHLDLCRVPSPLWFR